MEPPLTDGSGGLPADDYAEEQAAEAAMQPALGADGQPLPPPKVLNLTELRRKSAAELLETAESQGVDNISRAKK